MEKDITTSLTSQHQKFNKNMKLAQTATISSLQESTKTACTQTMSEMRATLEEDSNTLLNAFADKITSTEATAIQTHLNKWTTLGNEMKKSHSKLVRTNSIAISNNSTLVAQLATSTKQIDSLKDTIAVNNATISSMTVNLNAMNVKIKSMKTTISDDYLSAVTTEVNSMISSLVPSKRTDKTTQDEIDLQL